MPDTPTETAAEQQPFRYSFDQKLGYHTHDGCGGPIISQAWSLWCLECRPGNLRIDPVIRAWIEDKAREPLLARIAQLEQQTGLVTREEERCR